MFYNNKIILYKLNQKRFSLIVYFVLDSLSFWMGKVHKKKLFYEMI